METRGGLPKQNIYGINQQLSVKRSLYFILQQFSSKMPRGMPVSEDLRISMCKAHDQGISGRKISASHSVPRSTVQDIINLYKRTGGVHQKANLADQVKLPEQIRKLCVKLSEQTDGAMLKN